MSGGEQIDINENYRLEDQEHLLKEQEILK